MRIEYNYNDYKDSEKATKLSHVTNHVLAFLYPVICLVNIAAIGFIGDATIKMLENSEAAAWQILIILLCVVAAIAADAILLLLKLSINLVCDRIAINDTYWDLSAQERKEIAKDNAKSRREASWWILKRLMFYTPLIAVGIACLVALYISITNNRTSVLLISLLILAIDVLACVFLRKRL